MVAIELMILEDLVQIDPIPRTIGLAAWLWFASLIIPLLSYGAYELLRELRKLVCHA